MNLKEKIQKSPFYSCPEKFMRVGQRARARVRVYDCPGAADPGPVHAEQDELGTVVHVEKGFWPTIRFDRTRTCTDVTDDEVEPLEMSEFEKMAGALFEKLVDYGPRLRAAILIASMATLGEQSLKEDGPECDCIYCSAVRFVREETNQG